MAKFLLIDRSKEFVPPNRQKIFLVLILIFGVVYIGRLAQLQVLSATQYSEKSQAQAVKRVRIKAQRGNIYSRDGEQLVYNDVSYAIAVTPVDFREYCLPLLASISGMSKDSILSIINQNSGVTRFNEIKIMGNADYSIISQIEEYSDYLPGVSVMIETQRVYNIDCHLAHVLGYTREISAKQLARRPYFRMGDIIGQTGIEATYDDWLRGREGTKFYTVNNYGEKVETFETNKLDVAPISGADVYLTIDMKMQKRAEEMMRNHRGSVVAINPNTGEILTLVSAPDFDVSGFSGKIKQEFLDDVYSNQAKPLFNRAIAASYPPGSTWKMLIAIAGISENIVTTKSPLSCPGYYELGDRRMACHGAHGNISVRNALKVSCNTYFGKLGNKLGIKRFTKWGNLFNFGRPTGIDIAGEVGGLLPDQKYLEKRFGKYGVAPGRLANFGIGQGEILVTPLQLAVYTAAIANGGKIIQPHVISQIDNKISGTSMPVDYGIVQLPIEKNTIEAIKDGMFGVVNGGGTGGAAYIPGKNVCGKTGTAQNPHGKSHALFVCFAPRENPEIAIAIVIENAGYGGEMAAPIARQLLMQHFYPEWFSPDGTNNQADVFVPDSLGTSRED